jgi:organic radical activating enzyme
MKNIFRVAAGGLFDPNVGYTVRFETTSNILLKEIRELSNKDAVHLVQINAEIMGITEKFLRFLTCAYECPMCGNIMAVPQTDDGVREPSDCSNPNCQNKKDWIFREEDSESIPVRIGFLKDKTQNLKIVIKGDNPYNPGDIVKCFGIMLSEQIETRGKAKKNQFRIYLAVNNMEKIGENQYSQNLTNDSRVYFSENGIFLDKVTQDNAITETLFSWAEFHIEHRYVVDQGPTKECHYIGYVRLKDAQTKISFYNANIRDVKNAIQLECAVSGKNINFCTMPLQIFLNNFPESSDQISMLIGFTATGWKLPHNAICLVQDHMGNDILQNLRNVFDHPVDTPDTITKFRKIYEITGIAHKDQMFQWAIISPFLYVFREIGGVMPGIAIQGPAQTGKSRFFEMVVRNWFGHQKEIQNADNVKSASRLESLIAGSTLPIFIDDCTNTHVWMVDVLKSYLTLESNFLRKGAGIGGQFATVNKPLCASLSLSCNITPNWFSDDAFLERMYLEIIDLCDQQPGWFEARDAIIPGSILQILYEFTKDWKKDDLQKWIKDIIVPSSIKGDSRKKYIYLAFAAGAKFLKHIFQIDTELDRILFVLNRTRQTNLDALLGLIEYQIDQGKIREHKVTASSQTNSDQNSEATIDQFIPSKPKYHFRGGTWVKHPVYRANYEDELKIKRIGYVWNTNNIRDLQTQFEGNNTAKWSSQTFLIKIQKQYPMAEAGKYTAKIIGETGDLIDKPMRGVVIPTDYFIETDIE